MDIDDENDFDDDDDTNTDNDTGIDDENNLMMLNLLFRETTLGTENLHNVPEIER